MLLHFKGRQIDLLKKKNDTKHCVLCKKDEYHIKLIKWLPKESGTPKGVLICDRCKEQCGGKMITGTRFEREFKAGIDTEKIYHSIHQGAVPFSAMGFQKVPAPKGLIDFYFIARGFIAHAVEIKFTRDKCFAFDRVKDHQLKELQSFDDKSGRSWILIGFFAFGKIKARLFDLYAYRGIQSTLEKKSMNFKLDYEVICKYSVSLPRIKKLKNFYIDISSLTKKL